MENKSIRKKIGEFAESSRFQNFIMIVIILNSISLGFETSGPIMRHFGFYLHLFDNIVIAIFVIEILLKLYAFDLKFFRSGWNIFDFTIVAIALIPAAGPLTVLRALRILRALRLLKTVPRLRIIVEALLKSLPDLTWITFLTMLVFYIYAVIGTKLFAVDFPEYFGTLWKTMFTLFQVMTLESWASGIARQVMNVFPMAHIYFVSFIIIATIMVLNVIIGVLLNGLQAAKADENLILFNKIEEEISIEGQQIIQEVERNMNFESRILLREIKLLNKKVEKLNKIISDKN